MTLTKAILIVLFYSIIYLLTYVVVVTIPLFYTFNFGIVSYFEIKPIAWIEAICITVFPLILSYTIVSIKKLYLELHHNFIDKKQPTHEEILRALENVK